MLTYIHVNIIVVKKKFNKVWMKNIFVLNWYIQNIFNDINIFMTHAK